MDKVGHSLRDMKATKLGRGGRLAREAHYAALEREINRNRRLHAMLPNLKQPSASATSYATDELASLLRPIIRGIPAETLQHPSFGSAFLSFAALTLLSLDAIPFVNADGSLHCCTVALLQQK